MSMVGSFLVDHRRTVRAEVNPLDKSTIISIFPKDIEEKKYTITPGYFFIPRGSYEEPSAITVGPSSWWKDVGDDQPLLEIPNSSIQIADSVIRDYCNGLLAFRPDAMPGLFFVPGEVSQKEVKIKFRNKLNEALARQKNWYIALVRMADALWSRTNGNPLAISDDMRLGARELGLNTKEWLQDFQAMETIRCVACGQMRNPAFPVCPNCKAVIDVEKAKSLNLKFAE